MVLVRVGAQGRQDRGVHVGRVGREQGLVTQVHERLVRVVTQELLDVLGQAERIVQVLRVLLLVLVELVQQRVRVVAQVILALLARLIHGQLILVADVVAVNGLVADDEADQVSRVGELGVRAPVHGRVEARVEQEGLEHRRGDLALLRVVAVVVGLDDLGLLLQGLVLVRPAEGLIDFLRGQQGGEDRRVGLGVHRLHERNVRVDGLLVRGARVRDQRHRADRALQRVQQGQAREHAVRHELLVLGEGLPARQVVGEWNLLRQPEVARQAIPDLKVLVVLDLVPVDGLEHGLGRHGGSSTYSVGRTRPGRPRV